MLAAKTIHLPFMRFLVDAHLSPSLCAVLVQRSHDANHTLDLAAKNATKDAALNQISLGEQGPCVSNRPFSTMPALGEGDAKG
jgi:hypothetical protein